MEGVEQILGGHKPKAPWGLTAEEEEGPRDVCSVQKILMVISQLEGARGGGGWGLAYVHRAWLCQ